MRLTSIASAHRRVRSGLLIASILLISSCTSADVMRIDLTPRPAKADWREVEALFEEPDRPYTRIAIIQADDDGNDLSLDKIKERIQKEAAKLGADAVIIGMPSTGPGATYVIPIGEIFYAGTSTVKSLSGVAIVWEVGGR